eukprot:2589759-Prymnesium_polylepis.1
MQYPGCLPPHISVGQRSHPGYQGRAFGGTEGERYARDIAESDIAIAGSRFQDAHRGSRHSHPWLVAKHFEIPAAGTVMLTDAACEPYLATLGFIAN